MMNTERVIFLDIDGVLALPCTRFNYFHRPCTERLLRLVEDTDAKIVVSSSWRKGKTIDGLRDIFFHGGDRAFLHGIDSHTINPIPFPRERIIGKTPVSSRESKDGVPFGRGHEVQMWMEECGEKVGLKSYVVIDDERFDLEDHAKNLVKTDMTLGLQDNDVELAKGILMRP